MRAPLQRGSETKQLSEQAEWWPESCPNTWGLVGFQGLTGVGAEEGPALWGFQSLNWALNQALTGVEPLFPGREGCIG